MNNELKEVLELIDTGRTHEARNRLAQIISAPHRYDIDADPNGIRADVTRCVRAAITFCDNCGCNWLDDGLNPIGCPYCKQSAAVAAIKFALTDPEGMTFLRLWNEGEFDTIRREWPDAPSAVYAGADPLATQHQEPTT